MAAANLFDKALGYFAPKAALKRIAARTALARAYEGASLRDGWLPRRSGASANADHKADSPMLRARTRSLIQNNPYATKALNSLVANIIGEGIRPESYAADEKTRAALNSLWQQWVAMADADGVSDFYGLQALAYRAMEQDGEVLVRLRSRRPEDGLPVPLQVQLLEIDFLDSGKTGRGSNGGQIINGIEYDAIGRRAGYWLFDQHPGDGGGMGLVSRFIPADSIIHLYAPERPGQSRGVPRFAPVIARLRDLAIYEDAELARKQNEALLSVFVTGDGADFAIPGPGESQAAASANAAALGELGRLTPGAILAANGQNVTVAEPKAAPGYEGYVRQQLYSIAAGAGVTYEMLTGDLSQVNFSSSRMGLMEFRRAAAQRQYQVVVAKLLQPVWRAFVQAARLAGKIRAEDVAVEWSAPRWDYVNPVQDIEADTREIAAGLSSISEKLRQRGYKPDAVFKELGEDYQKLKATGALEAMAALMSNGGTLTAAASAEQSSQTAAAQKADGDRHLEAISRHTDAVLAAVSGIAAQPAVVELRAEPAQITVQHEPVQVAVDLRQGDQTITLKQEPAQIAITQEPVQVEVRQAETHVHLHKPLTRIEKTPVYGDDGETIVRVIERELPEGE